MVIEALYKKSYKESRIWHKKFIDNVANLHQQVVHSGIYSLYTLIQT